MKLIGRLFLLVFLLFIAAIIFGLGYIGYVPRVAKFLGTDKPKDLGIKFTEKDRVQASIKTGGQYATLPPGTSEELSLQRFGSHEVNNTWTSSEVSSLLNNRPWKYWPYTNAQVKFNADGSAEISTGINKAVFPSYAAFMGIPKQAAEFMMKLLPPAPVIYLKGKAALTDGKLTVFEPQVFELNRIPLPIAQFLAFNKTNLSLIKPVNAQLTIDLITDLTKVKNKKDLIINYVNDHLAGYISFFYAKEVRFEADKLIFKGRLPNQEAAVR